MTNRVANLMTIDFGPHILQAWYDTLSPGLRMNEVTRFILIAQAYDAAVFKGKKVFMANIWQMELNIDSAIQNLMLYLHCSDDVVQMVLKEKKELLQYLRGQ